MCMVGYTFLHGCKVFKKMNPSAPFSYKIVSLAMACTGGGILVPILLNTIPVTLAIDAYPIAIMISYLIHTHIPVLRDVLELSTIFKAVIILFYETMRTYVVTLFLGLAATTIAPSQFAVPIFGPIVCGTIAGCGGAFLPLNKGLTPIETSGLAPPMFTALVASVFFHGVTQMASAGYIEMEDTPKKARVAVALWFIGYAYWKNEIIPLPKLLSSHKPAVAVKVEKKD
mmetsp:Transcript_21993/g.46381  ORF Transcript_21993/g.46381 Transcript_21993/m.46381 type:complete len:228 (+) Transcript_21993:1051-1734(+)